MKLAKAGLAICAFAGLVWLLVARVLGPSDLWDHTQPRTISYTTDIIVHGGNHWILPMECGELPASKPPLYNWIAVPFVKLMGFNSELAHKMPSVIALCVCWLVLVRVGRWLDLGGDESVGWLAGLILVANQTMFKLGYLARPDMLLTLWLLLAWVCATAALVRARAKPQRGGGLAAFGFWICVALAGLSKGPAAMVAVVYALLAARLIGGSWKSFLALRPQWRAPLCFAIVGAWVYGVWRINPQHLIENLWGQEFMGRVTGNGSEGSHEGFAGWLKSLPYHPLYFLSRFFPWSLFAIAAMITLWRQRVWQSFHDRVDPWLCGAAIQILVVIALFTLSAGKRADYLAPAYPAGALLAAWWLMRMSPRLSVRMPWLAPVVAAMVLSALTVFDRIDSTAPREGYGDVISAFVERVVQNIAAEPMPVAYCWVTNAHLQAVLGSSSIDGKTSVDALIGKGSPFWVVAGRKNSEPHEFDQWLMERKKNVTIEAVEQSPMLPAAEGWPEQVTLYRVISAGGRNP